jgi:hypothetical protein
MAAAEGGAGPLPDYSLDFSKIRAARMHRRKAQSWSSGAVNSTGEEQQSTTAAGPRTANDADAGATDDSAAIRAPPNKVTFCTTLARAIKMD